MKNTKYKIGDTVELVSGKLPQSWTMHMSQYLGKVVRLTYVGTNGQIKFAGSEPWYFDIDNIKSIINPQTNMLTKIKQIAIELCKANNTVTTLEIKNELRKKFPNEKWYQSDVSDAMDEFYQEGIFTYNDNFSYRIYSLAVAKPAAKTNSAPVNKTSTSARKHQRISKTKAIELIENSNGKFFGATFTKKDNSVRNMRCRIEKGAKPTSLGYITVIDTESQVPKSLNLQTLSELRMNKTVYSVR